MDVEALAKLRFPVEHSRGRRYPEPSHPYRNDFQRDRDRVIHSRAFRRLENKTQVFAQSYSDHFRNRLTHTLEVTQIARTVAVALKVNEDLTETLALVHDIGHPPFAHAGEAELNRQMNRFGDQFDHNLHALRIVERFEQRYARFPGLNLTFEVREGIIKHSRDLTPGEDLGLEEYLPGLKPPLEAQIIDLADEIAYNTADLDDAQSAGLIQAQELAEAVPAVGALLEELEFQYPAVPERIRFLECVRRLIDILTSSLIEGTYMAARSMESIEEIRLQPRRLACFTPEGEQLSAALKAFLHQKVYQAEELARERLRSTQALASMFQFYLEHPEKLPENYFEKGQGEACHRVICDYIAGMTDGYFWKTWKSLVES
ncbi:MAG: dNTP triphosphohydrolase [Bryobacteraceae bacterium]|nr:dNTP triphosphohydrolase [Bryobacteraceae bacterium]MDW8378589.1 dNTP triphosphohydrolase [Bryobacterales bacterium]